MAYYMALVYGIPMMLLRRHHHGLCIWLITNDATHYVPWLIAVAYR